MKGTIMISNAQEKVNSKDFEYFFNRDIAPQLGALENERLYTIAKIKRLKKICSIITISIVVICVYLVFREENLFILPHAIIFPTVISIFVSLVVTNSPKINFLDKTKIQIFNSLFSFLGDFKYENSLEYKNLNYGNIPLFNEVPPLPSVDDCIIGTYNNRPIQINELYMNYKTRKSSPIVLFKGLFVSIEQPKNIESTIIISNKNYKYKTKKLPKINVNDQEIDYHYNISGLNPDSDYNYLTPELFEKLKKLIEMNVNAAICFHQNMIYIGIITDKNMFEIPFEKPITNIFIYKDIIKQLSTVFSIIDCT